MSILAMCCLASSSSRSALERFRMLSSASLRVSSRATALPFNLVLSILMAPSSPCSIRFWSSFCWSFLFRSLVSWCAFASARRFARSSAKVCFSIVRALILARDSASCPSTCCLSSTSFFSDEISNSALRILAASLRAWSMSLLIFSFSCSRFWVRRFRNSFSFILSPVSCSWSRSSEFFVCNVSTDCCRYSVKCSSRTTSS
mmetsp:Transcript_40885/g.109180  ORF Transcript_40885/g.109180 Transcript_40885/m.109180 type:complete len:202 (-) Transcript_40885:387-992(-)